MRADLKPHQEILMAHQIEPPRNINFLFSFSTCHSTLFIMQRTTRPLTVLKKRCLQASNVRVFSRALATAGTAEQGMYKQQCQPLQTMANMSN